MRVITDHARTYPEDPARYFDFARFAGQTAGDFAFFAGLFDFKALDSVPAGEPVVFLELEEPNRFLVPASAADFHHLDRDGRFAKVFTLCPFTAEWLNRRHGDERWAPAFFPFNERHTPAPGAKDFDVIYTGGVHAAGIERLIRDLAPFKFRFVSQLRHPVVTDFNCSYHEKLSLIARSRVTLVHNQLFVTRQQIENVARHPRWRENAAFAQLPLPGSPELLAAAPDQTWPAPQLKSRLFEAAFCRSLILCQRDPWNLVERYFTPGEEFVYFEPGRLAETLHAVLADYPHHAAIAERAHQRAVREYSTAAFFTKFLRDLHPAPAAKPKARRRDDLPPAEDFLARLQQARLWQPGQPLRLHLGCGERRFDGYVNVDFPPAEHTVQTSAAADTFADILALDLPAGTVDEVRLHHVFEHFDRPTALALLCRWHRWLRPAGRLTIETPDADASARLLSDPRPDHAQKQVVLRHLFGSHEAAWAVHYDGWYPAKFQRVLGALGFGEVQCELGEWQMTRNVTASAVKAAGRTPAEQTAAAAELLHASLVDHSASEQKLHAIWLAAFSRRFPADPETSITAAGESGHAALGAANPKPQAVNSNRPSPLVSIFIPAFNRGQYLPGTLDSLLAQTFRDFEIIVADDGSTDHTLAVARDYAQRDPRIRVLALPHRGEVAARNEAVMAAHPDSRYLMNHDSDDLSLPDKLARLVAHLEGHPEIGAVGCFAEYFDDAGKHLGQPTLEHEPARIRATFGRLNSMVNSATLIRRVVFERVGPYREAFRSVDDYDFFARALLAGFELANLPEVLHRIRLHAASVGSTRALQQEQLAAVIRADYQAGRVPGGPAAPAPRGPRRASRSTRLNLLHTVEFYAPHTGGAEAVVQQLSERLARRGHRVTVATTRLPERTFAELNGVVIADFAVSGKLAEGIHGEFARYQQFLREHDCDVMMNYAAQQWATDMAMPLLPELPARRANVLAPCGYSALADVRTLRWPQFRAYFQDFLPQVLPLYDAAVYHSAAYQDFEFGQRLGLTNGLVIPNGTDADEFTRPVAVNFREKHRITTPRLGLCVANFMPGKGQERVLECVRRLARPDFTMVFIGRDGGTLAALKAQAAGLNVRFLTGLPREDTVAAFRSADVFLFGSHVEASPLVILEAKAARLPFVSTDCGNVREWQGGIVCAPEEMAAHTAKLLNTPQLHAELAEAGHREWKEKLTWDAVVDQWEDLYLRLAHARPGAGEPPSAATAPITKGHAGDLPSPPAASASQPVATRTTGDGCLPPVRARTVVLAFSKDRALQLDATLRSFHRHCRDAASACVRVLFHAGDDRHRAQYAALAREHPAVEFIAERAFKPDLLAALAGAEEVLFLVDDNLFVRDFALAELRAALAAEPRALGYSLRLGRNTAYCYALDRAQALPDFTSRATHTLAFGWPGAACDFGYPLEVSSSLYRLAELRPLLEALDFKNPNTLEARLAESAGHFRDSHPLLLCAPQSLAFCAPVNKVQATFANRAGAEAALSAEALADRFATGERVDVAAYDGFTPSACHQEVELRLARQAGVQPLVSVVIPCFKQAHLLPEAVASVVAQSFTAWEILIVNDGSPDDTAAVAEQLSRAHPGRCIRLLNQANQGLATARNHGIAATRGKYILPLDADDALAPDFLAQTVAVLEAEPEVHIVFTDLLRFGDADGVYHTGEFAVAKLAVLNQLNYCSLYRREVFTAVGGYNPNLVWGYEDWDFWIGAAERGFKARKIAAPLFYYRIKAGSMLTTAAQRDAELRARIVLNHPKLYDAASREQAAHIWARVAAEAEALRPAAFGKAAAASLVPARAGAKPPAIASRKLRVTYLIESILGVTGGNQTLLRQAEELRRRGHDVTIVTRTDRPAWFQFQVRVVRTPEGRPLSESVPASDVVISTYFTNTHELAGLTAPVKVYYAQGDQYVFDDATLPDTEQHRMLRQLSRLSYQAPGARFVANSHHLARAVERATGRRADAILPVCTDQTIFRPLPRALPGSKPRILVVGPDARGTREEPLSFKGLAEIHDALALLAKRCPHFTVVRVSGTGPEIFAQFPCEFHLAPPDELKTFLFGTADVLIYASHYDSCPRPPQEAMAAGAAVVCTDTPGAREYCRDGENCLLVPVRTPEAIADAVERLLRDRVLRERLVAGGLATAKEFPREREWDELEALLLQWAEEAATPAAEVRAQTIPLQATVSAGGDSASAGPARAQLKLPPVALLGDLQSARAALARCEHPVAWTECLAALAARPFHPEAWLLLAEIARAGDDGAMARECAARARQLAPRWPAARQFEQSLPAESLDWQVRWPAALPKPGAPRLTVFVIARNEEQFLPQCLASVRGLADQLIVVDTGSTDRTAEIAREHGAQVWLHPWADDFSAARNAALERATGDWVLFLDADEELPAAEHDGLRADMAAPEVLAVRLRLENVGQEEDGVCHVPRLWRNAPGLFFHGRVHEQVFPSILVKCEAWGLETRLGTATLRHHGYRPDVVRDRNKVERNLRLLRRAVEELPGEPMLLMNLGLELVRSNQLRAGLAQYREAFRRLEALPEKDVVPELREALLTQFVCHLHTAREFAEVLRVLASPLAEAGGRTASMHFMAALACLELKRFDEGAEHARQCLANRNLPTLTPINRDIRKAGPHHVLALCLWGAQRHDDVEQAFLDALAEDAGARAVRFDFARWLAERGRKLDALHLLHKLVTGSENEPRVWVLGAQIALSHPEFIEFACDWTGEAVAHQPEHTGLAALRAEALLLSGRATEAHDWLAQVAAPTPAQGAARVLAALAGGLAVPAAALPDELAVSGEFVRWYRRLVEFGAEAVITAVNGRLEELRTALPTAAGHLATALTEAAVT